MPGPHSRLGTPVARSHVARHVPARATNRSHATGRAGVTSSVIWRRTGRPPVSVIAIRPSSSTAAIERGGIACAAEAIRIEASEIAATRRAAAIR
jgi:hypothetical protein